MTDALAVTDLFDQVKARFATEAPAVGVVFGWRRPDFLEESPRLVFVPGDDLDAGTIGAPVNAGTEPRHLAMLDELVTIYVAARDDSDRDDERKQYEACRFLFDACVRALYLAATGTYEFRSLAWVDPATTLRTGAALRLVLAVQAPIPDAPLTFVTPTVAHVENRLGDTEDTDDDVPEPPPP